MQLPSSCLLRERSAPSTKLLSASEIVSQAQKEEFDVLLPLFFKEGKLNLLSLMPHPPQLLRKILVIGDGACGKTSLLNVFTRGFFPQEYEPTVFENYVHSMALENGPTIELSLWDTAGQEDFDRLRSLSYADTHVVLICFSSDNPVSLENVENKWIQEVNEHCPGVKTCLIALKCDMREDIGIQEKLGHRGMKPISYDQGLGVARRIKASRYLECSAKFNRGVSEAFLEAARVSVGAKAKGNDSSLEESSKGCVVC